AFPVCLFFFSSRRRHTRSKRDWSSDVCSSDLPNVRYSALVPNMKGLELALEAGIDGASVFMSASEEHNKSNINKTIDETFPVLKEVIHEAKRAGKHVTGYVSTVFACPFAGRIT